jgi:hypothetical protein
MHDSFWVKISKDGYLYTVERYYLDESRITYCQKRFTLTKFGAKMSAKRFINNKIAEQYIKEKS